MLLNEEQNVLENSLQLVVPSTAQILKHKLENQKTNPILITGELMAGEPWHKIVYEKCTANPESVIMTVTAARSLRYNLDQVTSKGVKIIHDNQVSDYSELTTYHTRDVNWERIIQVLRSSEIDPQSINTVLLCCQDHGEPEDPWRSSRDFRMKSVYKNLENSPKLENLLMRADLIPKELPRLQSIANSAVNYFSHLTSQDVFVMDSSPAVILGTIQSLEHELIINVGNGHTLAVFLTRGKVQAIYETHTGSLKSDNIQNLIRTLDEVIQGKITHDEILDAGGHGLFRTQLIENHTIKDYGTPIVIGPNRSKLASLDVIYAHPIGNMMMAGPFGLIRAYKNFIGSHSSSKSPNNS